jgi:hypothetical protein
MGQGAAGLDEDGFDQQMAKRGRSPSAGRDTAGSGGGRGGGANAKRASKDEQYGFGGRKKVQKQNDAASAADMSAYKGTGGGSGARGAQRCETKESRIVSGRGFDAHRFPLYATVPRTRGLHARRLGLVISIKGRVSVAASQTLTLSRFARFCVPSVFFISRWPGWPGRGARRTRRRPRRRQQAPGQGEAEAEQLIKGERKRSR